MKIKLGLIDSEQEIKIPPMGIMFYTNNNKFRIYFGKNGDCIYVMKIPGRLFIEPEAANHIKIK